MVDDPTVIYKNKINLNCYMRTIEVTDVISIGNCILITSSFSK